MSDWFKQAIRSVAILGFFAAAPAAAQAPFDPPGLDRAIVAQELHTDRLFLTDGVVGTGVGVNARGRAAIVIMTEDLWVTGLPRSLDGVPVVVRVTGAFHAINPPPHDHGGGGGGGDEPSADADPCDSDPTARCDLPVPIGVSTGNANSCSAGTIGARVIDDYNNVYALSNNHVYALENNAEMDDVINQPGVFDTYDETNCVPVAGDQVGTLAGFVLIDFDGGDNLIDAAIALTDTSSLGNATPSDGYGTPNSTTAAPTACLNKRVQKYGRTTSLTKGSVFTINATVQVVYSGGVAKFVNQIVVDGGGGGFILPGDSGSLLILQRGKKPCGLLFAGSSTGKFGIANPINDVLNAFGVTIDGN